jgi:hypothetical protein
MDSAVLRDHHFSDIAKRRQQVQAARSLVVSAKPFNLDQIAIIGTCANRWWIRCTMASVVDY